METWKEGDPQALFDLRNLVAELYEADMRALNCPEPEIQKALLAREKIANKLYEACGLGGDE